MTLNKGRPRTPCKEIVEGQSQDGSLRSLLMIYSNWHAGFITDVSIPYGRWQKFEVADLKLAAFFDQNHFKIEVRIKISIFFQFLHADPLSLRHILKFLRRQFSVDLPAQTCSPDVG